MLSCIEKCYVKMEKEGLTPLFFDFPAFNVTVEQYSKYGKLILTEQVKVKLSSKYYNIALDYYDLISLEQKLINKSASINEINVFKKLEKQLETYINNDIDINNVTLSHKILNKICGDTMKIKLAELLFVKGTKQENEFNEVDFIATIIMLKHQLPQGYKIVQNMMKSILEYPTDINQFNNDNDVEIALAQLQIKENIIKKRMIIAFNVLEINPNLQIIQEIIKYDKKLIGIFYPSHIKEFDSLIKHKI